MMSDIWPVKIASILSSGILLVSCGVNNWAFNREEALSVICELEDIGVAILGGDVYRLINGELECTYDSWYCDEGVGESELEFVRRSASKARDYIRNYMVSDALFAVVPKF